jgi:hypothetical protein
VSKAVLNSPSDPLSINLYLLERDIHAAEEPNQEIRLPEIPFAKSTLIRRVKELESNGGLASDYSSHLWRPARKCLQSFRNNEFAAIRLPLKERVNYLRQKGERSPKKLAESYENAHVIAQVILQHGNNFEWEKTKALQQLACDMWNTFVQTSGVCPTGNCHPPVIVWGEGEDGPYALYDHDFKVVRLGEDAVPIISIPRGYLSKGVLGWTILGHESAHTILEQFPGALKEISRTINENISDYSEKLSHDFRTRGGLSHFWSSRVSEIAADVLGILYMGPAAAIGLIASLRGSEDDNHLSNRSGEEHPADTLRGLVAAYAVNRLDINPEVKRKWFNYLMKEVKKDFDSDEVGMSWRTAKICAEIVADTVMDTSIIDGRSLKQIHCWGNDDERLVDYYLGEESNKDGNIPYQSPHIVAAAGISLLFKQSLLIGSSSKTQEIFNHMIQFLNQEADRRSCLSCPLSQKEIYPLNSTSYTSKPTYSDENKSCIDPSPKSIGSDENKPGIDPLMALGIGVGAVAIGSLVVLALSGAFSGNKGRRVQTTGRV